MPGTMAKYVLWIASLAQRIERIVFLKDIMSKQPQRGQMTGPRSHTCFSSTKVILLHVRPTNWYQSVK